MQSNLLERMNAQNLQSSVEASGQFQLLVQYGYQQICLVMNQIENLRENKANGYHPCSIASSVQKKFKSVTSLFLLLSMKNNMISKIKTPLTGHQWFLGRICICSGFCVVGFMVTQLIRV